MHQPFAGLIGQSPAIELLTRAVEQNRIAPAYLFAGLPGVGRRLAAYGLLELLLSRPEHPSSALRHRIEQGNHPDVFWVEPTYWHQGKRLTVAEAIEQGIKARTRPQIRLEQIREITRFLSRPPLESDRAVVVLEDAETMAEATANALLKTLEEPGAATLILIAPSVDALLPTLVSRCQRIPFQPLSVEAIAQVLTQTGHAEILQHPELLALAQGSPGAAIAHWQKLQMMPPDLLQALQQPPATLRQALELARQIPQSLDTEAQLWLIDYLQHHYWQTYLQSDLLQLLETARQHLLYYVQPRLVWEVTLMRIGCQENC
jgi:DNA polymerase-3 subunit delta'